MTSSQDTICTLCFETFKNPLILKCGHNLCEPCVKRAEELFFALKTLEPPNKKKQDGDAPVAPSVSCPLCGKVSLVSECKPNITLRNVLSLRQNAAELELPGLGAASTSAGSEKPVCGFCKKPATVFCAFCGPLCQADSDMLHVKGPLRTHELSSSPVEVVKTIKEAVGEADADESSKMVLPLCKDHGKPMELFCSKCETLVCSHCILVGEHKGHECSGVVQAFEKTNQRIEALLKEIKEKAPECEGLVKDYERLRAGADEEQKRANEQIRDTFAQFRAIVDQCQAECEKEVKDIFTSFQEFVKSRSVSLHSLSEECSLVQKSVDASAAKNDLIRYTLFKSMKNLVEHLAVISSAKVPEDATICQVNVNKGMLDKEKFGLVKVRSTFRRGGGRILFYDIDFEAVQRTRNVTSEIRAGNNTSHDGGAIFDPVRRIILSISGNFNNGRNLKITRMADDTHGETTLMPDVIPYGTHGQYPVYDGRQYTYFFQSEDGGNNRLGRVDMDTMTFEGLPNLPTSSYREFCRPCFQNGHIYALDRDLNIRDFDVEASTWRTMPVTVPRPGCLLADPMEPNNIYSLCIDGRGLFRIDIAEETSTHVCDTPSNFSLGANGEALLVRTSPSEFLVFSCLSGGWHVYSSERQRWAPIPNWRNTRNGSGHFLISPDGPRAFYHVDDSERWETVNLRGE